jgi:hypothetical protein
VTCVVVHKIQNEINSGDPPHLRRRFDGGAASTLVRSVALVRSEADVDAARTIDKKAAIRSEGVLATTRSEGVLEAPEILSLAMPDEAEAVSVLGVGALLVEGFGCSAWAGAPVVRTLQPACLR